MKTLGIKISALALLVVGSMVIGTSDVNAAAITSITASPATITQAGGNITFTATGNGARTSNGAVGFYIPAHSTPVAISFPCPLRFTGDGQSGHVYMCTDNRVPSTFGVSWTVRVNAGLPCGTNLIAYVDIGNLVWRSVTVPVVCPTPVPTPPPTPAPTPTPTPTPTATPTPAPFTCSPDVQTVKVGEQVTITSTGSGNTVWTITAQDGSTRTVTGKNLTTTFTEAGIYLASAKDDGREVACKVMVQAEPTPTPSPTPTPTATPTPTPTPEPETPGIDVEKDDGRTITRPGHSLTYQIVVKNTAEADLHDVLVEDLLPKYLTATAVSAGGTIDGQTVRWYDVQLNEGESKSFTITAKVAENAPNGTLLENVVQVSSDDKDVSDEDTDLTEVKTEPIVKGAVEKKVIIKEVPVTAQTGAAGALVSLLTLAGGTGLVRTIRKSF